tara:strand:- start:655 stop:831 length:177 start_codon:yes stop_codon:yes gene_type:complete
MFLDLQILNTIDLVRNAQHLHKEDLKMKLALRKAKDKQKDLEQNTKRLDKLELLIKGE